MKREAALNEAWQHEYDQFDAVEMLQDQAEARAKQKEHAQ